MKKRLLFILCLFFVGSGAAAAQQRRQVRTITNQDLEKFRQTRLQAERDYRENYQKLGFPSPEELNRQREQDRKDRAELAGRIRREDLELEKIKNEAEFQQAQIDSLQSNRINQGYAYYNNGGYYGSYPLLGYGVGYSNRYFNNGFRRNRFGGVFYNVPRSGFGRPGIRFNSGGGVRVNVRIGNGGRGASIGGGGGRRR